MAWNKLTPNKDTSSAGRKANMCNPTSPRQCLYGTDSRGWTPQACAQARDPNPSFLAMVNDGRVRMPGISHQLAISCLLHLCSCSHSLESCHSSKIEPDGTSNLMTRMAHQFESNVSTESEVLPLEIPKRCFANLAPLCFFGCCWCKDSIRRVCQLR